MHGFNARTFVLSKGKSQRFWNVYKGIFSVITSEGKSGPGETTVHDEEETGDKNLFIRQLIEERLAEGYVETTNDPWHGGCESELRTKLEDAIVEDPEDVGAHHAYADHLIELGDPRGEFIQVQLALEDESLSASERKSLRAREKRLLAKHERSWLGPMQHFWIDKLDALDSDEWTSHSPHQLKWKRGWIDSLWLEDGWDEAGAVAAHRAPLLRCLRDLRFLYAHDDNDGVFNYFLNKGILENVRVYHQGFDEPSLAFSGQISAQFFLNEMSKLEEFHTYIEGNADHFFAMKYPKMLQRLTVHYAWKHYPLEDIIKNKTLHNLTHLSCWPRGQWNSPNEQQNYNGGYAWISRSSAVKLFRSGKLKQLQHLTIRNSDIGDDGAREMIESGFFHQLKTLDLQGGCITDVGAELLAKDKHINNLESLNLNRNLIGRKGISALKKTKVKFTANDQLGPELIHTREYLYQGNDE